MSLTLLLLCNIKFDVFLTVFPYEPTCRVDDDIPDTRTRGRYVEFSTILTQCLTTVFYVV